MAPRRGNLRIDAALDAMIPFGFSPKLVRNTVKELLGVYGGDDGWVFIEEGSYTLLIDAILEKLKDGAVEKDHQENERAGDHTETSVAGCSSGFNEASSSNPREFTLKQSDDVLNSAYMTNEAFDTTLPTSDSEQRCRKDYKDSGGGDRFGSTLNQSSPADTATISRRRRYHGWISCDDKEDFVHLTPAPLPEGLAEVLRPPRKRDPKKRWDVKPGDL